MFTPGRRFWILIAAFVVGAGPMVVLNGILLLGSGPWATPGAEFLMLPGLVAVPAVVVAVPFLGFRRTRRGGTTALLALLILFLATFVGFFGGGRLRMLAFHLAAQRAEPLVDAITRFESENARPPSTLQELMPRYLSRVPEGIPPLELLSGEAAAKHYAGNTWALRAAVGVGVLNFDEFIYLPQQNYDGRGALERIRGWAYLHE
jgi:hypothetical protein